MIDFLILLICLIFALLVSWKLKIVIDKILFLIKHKSIISKSENIRPVDTKVLTLTELSNMKTDAIRKLTIDTLIKEMEIYNEK